MGIDVIDIFCSNAGIFQCVANARRDPFPIGSGIGQVIGIARQARPLSIPLKSVRPAPVHAREFPARGRRLLPPSQIHRGRVSQGRDAFVGSSLRWERALHAQKPATPIGMIGASTPPASMRSASPFRICCAAAMME